MDSTVPVARAGRFEAPLDRAYHPMDHTWVKREGDRLRVGMDSLGVETTGDLAQLYLSPAGTIVAAGDELGTIEAQKFVGPLRAPVAGTVVQVNDRVLENPMVVTKDPYGEGWLLLIDPIEEPSGLIEGEAVHAWFAESLEEYKRQGSVAE